MTELPIFPLKTVLFPGGSLPLRVFETRYVDMTRNCLRNNRPFGVCLIREGKEVGAPALPHELGCLATIVDCDTQQLGVFQLQTIGGQRFRINRQTANSQGLILADVTLIEDEPRMALPEDFRNCAQLLQLMLERHGDALFPKPHRLDDADWVGFRLAERLPLPLSMRQQLLEMDDNLQRLTALQRLLTGIDPSPTTSR
jgi:Lon protease-like protein